MAPRETAQRRSPEPACMRLLLGGEGVRNYAASRRSHCLLKRQKPALHSPKRKTAPTSEDVSLRFWGRWPTRIVHSVGHLHQKRYKE